MKPELFLFIFFIICYYCTIICRNLSAHLYALDSLCKMFFATSISYYCIKSIDFIVLCYCCCINPFKAIHKHFILSPTWICNWLAKRSLSIKPWKLLYRTIIHRTSVCVFFTKWSTSFPPTLLSSPLT